MTNQPTKTIFIFILVLVVIVLLIILIEGETKGAFPVVYVWSAIGILCSLVRRYKLRKENTDKSFLDIIANDYYFSKYATLSLLSFTYALVQGAGVGSALYFIFQWFKSLSTDDLGTLTHLPLLYSVLSLLAIVFSRIILEGYTILYRTAQDFSDYARRGRTE